MNASKVNTLRISTLSIFLLIITCGFSHGQSNEKEKISELLRHFLDSVSYPQMHDRFWAEDLIYTSSAGERFGKSKIITGMTPPTEQDLQNATEYQAEDVNIRFFGTTAALTFKLIGVDGDKRAEYWNSGLLVKRQNRWKVVLWQATKVP